MYGLQVTLFGRFQLHFNGEGLSGIEGRRTQELLAYLLLYRGRCHPREVLAETLWRERPDAQSRKYLRQALWQVQATLNKCVPVDSGGALQAEAEWVQVNPAASVWLDVAEFEHAHAQAQGVAGGDLSVECAEYLGRAVELYRGDLLEGCYEDWCLFERERLQNIYLAMLDKLIDWCQEHHRYEEGLDHGSRILRYDRARERTHRRMMRLYYLAGDRTSALRQYEQLERALREELNVQPARRSVNLWEQMRADTYDDGPPTTRSKPGASPLPGSHKPDSDPRAHLRHLHGLLTDMQRQIRREIEAIELALTDS